MFQQAPKPVGSGGGGRKQPQPKHETDHNAKRLSPSPTMTKASSDSTISIESTIQQSIASINMKEPDYCTFLGGGKTPPEQWELYQNELKDPDADSQEAKHNRLLIDKSGKTDPLFYMRKDNSKNIVRRSRTIPQSGFV
jgi:hypothetical protein